MEEKRNTTSFRGRLPVSKLKEIANKSRQHSKEKGEEVREKRAKKRIPSFVDTNCGQNKKDVLNSNTVRDWFKTGIERNYGEKIQNPFGGIKWVTNGKQGMLAKKMLSEYHADTVKKSIDYMCDNWEVIITNSQGRISGLPTIELLWGMRAQIFADAELGRIPVIVDRSKKKVAGKKKHMVGEFDPDSLIGAPDIGW